MTIPNGNNLYLELLKKCVGNFIYDDDLNLLNGELAVDSNTGRVITIHGGPCDSTEKHLGQVWPSRAHTMIGLPRLNNLQYCIEQALKDDIPGDLIETGVWRGGAVIFMRGVLEAYGVRDRQVWVADSFCGLPRADYDRYPKETRLEFNRCSQLEVSEEEVRRNFSRYGLLDDQVRFLPGWFKDTLPSAPITKLSVMRLDGDMYESTICALQSLYDRLCKGGFVIIDDYNAVESCNEAVHDFRSDRGIHSPLQRIEGAGAFWRK